MPELFHLAASHFEEDCVGGAIPYTSIAPYVPRIDRWYASYPRPEAVVFDATYPKEWIDPYLKHDPGHIARTLVNTLLLIEEYKKNNPGVLTKEDEVIAINISLYHDVASGDPYTHAANGAHHIQPYLESVLPRATADMVVAGIMVHSQTKHREHFPIAFKIAFDADALDLPRMGTISDEKLEFLTEEARRMLPRAKEFIEKTKEIYTAHGVVQTAKDMGMVTHLLGGFPPAGFVYVQ